MDKITVTPLGTISPYTKGNMNCPGFLVNYKESRLLLDCGNGITRLMSFPDDLKNLSVIITHYHKDHFGDLGILQYASFVYHNLGLLNDRVKVYLPQNDFGFNKKSIISNNESFCEYHDINDSFHFEDLIISFEDNKSHSIESFMIKLQNGDFKMVYTSDVGTTNFEKLIEFCKNADLIISESSFLKSHNSNSKTHLTAYDAGLLASKAKAKRLLLTHLWPEESKDKYLEEAKTVFDDTELALEGKKMVLSK